MKSATVFFRGKVSLAIAIVISFAWTFGTESLLSAIAPEHRKSTDIPMEYGFTGCALLFSSISMSILNYVVYLTESKGDSRSHLIANRIAIVVGVIFVSYCLFLDVTSLLTVENRQFLCSFGFNFITSYVILVQLPTIIWLFYRCAAFRKKVRS